MELAPDPFTEWGPDAQSLLATNASLPAASRRRRRALLQDGAGSGGSSSTTGMVPVQGRVGIREARAAVDPSGSAAATGSVALDESGDITLVCQAGSQCPEPPTSQGGMSETPTGGVQAGAGSQGSAAAAPAAPAGSAAKLPLLNVLLIALVVPAGLALCAAGAAVVVLRRGRRKEKGHEPKENPKQAGPVTRPAMLRHSTNCSEAGGQGVSGDGTCVQPLQPGETGFGSMPGGIARFGAGGLPRYPSIDFTAGMVTLPPARDSMDLSSQLQRATRGSIDWSVMEPPHAAAAHGTAKWSMAGSLAGMATSVAHAVHFR